MHVFRRLIIVGVFLKVLVGCGSGSSHVPEQDAGILAHPSTGFLGAGPGTGGQACSHDATLTGNCSPASPLHVVAGGGNSGTINNLGMFTGPSALGNATDSAIAGSITDSNAAGYKLVNLAATATVPTLIPNQLSATTGIGGTSGNVSLITSGVESLRFTLASHGLVGGSAPALSACGTGPACAANSTCTDAAGRIATGTANTGCTITFANTYTKIPACSCSCEVTLAICLCTPTAGAITFTLTANTSAFVDYICLGPTAGGT